MNGNNSIIWLIIILVLFGGCGNNGIGNLFGGCGNGCNNDSAWIIILIIILFCCCGNGFSLCDNNC